MQHINGYTGYILYIKLSRVLNDITSTAFAISIAPTLCTRFHIYLKKKTYLFEILFFFLTERFIDNNNYSWILCISKLFISNKKLIFYFE